MVSHFLGNNVVQFLDYILTSLGNGRVSRVECRGSRVIGRGSRFGSRGSKVEGQKSRSRVKSRGSKVEGRKSKILNFYPF